MTLKKLQSIKKDDFVVTTNGTFKVLEILSGFPYRINSKEPIIIVSGEDKTMRIDNNDIKKVIKATV